MKSKKLLSILILLSYISVNIFSSTISVNADTISRTNESAVYANSDIDFEIEQLLYIVNSILPDPSLPANEGGITLVHESTVALAQSKFLALSEEQVSKIPLETIKKLNACVAKIEALKHQADLDAVSNVKMAITSLPSLDELTVNDEGAVNEAYNQYLNLTPNQRKIMEENEATSLTTLVNLVNRLPGLKVVAPVEALIIALPEDHFLTLNDEKALTAANTAFNKLNASNRKIVKKEYTDKLTKLLDKMKDLKEAAAIDAAEVLEFTILQLPEDLSSVTLDDEKLVKSINDSYKKLTSFQKSKIAATSKERLANVTNRINDLKLIAPTVKLIDNLPNEYMLSLKDEKALISARQSYLKLSKAHRELVDLDPELKGKLDKLDAKMILLKKEASDNAVENVVFKFSKLPAAEALTLSDEAAVKDVKDSYNKLTTAEKTIVNNKELLIGTENKKIIDILYAVDRQIYNLKSLAPVEKAIIALPEEYAFKLSDEKKLESAKQAVLKLSLEQKTLLEKNKALMAKLEALTNKLNTLKNEVVSDIIKDINAKIDSLPSDLKQITLDYEKFVNEIATLCSKLPNTDLIPKIEYFNTVKQRIMDLKAVAPIEKAIAALPSIEKLQLRDESKVMSVYDKFQALTDKTLISEANINKLNNLKARLEVLKVEQNNASVTKVKDLMLSIPDVTKLTVKDERAVKTADTEFKKLDQTLQNMFLPDKDNSVPELVTLKKDRLDKGFERIAVLKDVATVEKLINSIPTLEKLKVSDEKKINAADTAYNNLLSKYPNYEEANKDLGLILIAPEFKDKLKAAKDFMIILQTDNDKAMAMKMEATILALPDLDMLTLKDESKIKTAQSSYNKLTSIQKSLVSTDLVNELNALVTHVANLKAAYNVEKLIISLPKISSFRPSHSNKVKSVFSTYMNPDKLTSDQRKLIEKDSFIKLMELARMAGIEESKIPSMNDIYK